MTTSTDAYINVDIGEFRVSKLLLNIKMLPFGTVFGMEKKHCSKSK